MNPSIPDPITQPGDAFSLAERLYHSGAYLCLGIVAAFIALRWASKHIGWLEVPNRAHYVSALLGGLALLAFPASQGTTPNLSMIVVAVGTVISLCAPGAKAPPPSSSQPSMAKLQVLSLATIAFVAMLCAGASCGAKLQATEQSYVDCLEEHVKERVPQLLPTVTSILTSGVSDWKAQLEALAMYAGKDALACAVQTAEQELLAKLKAAGGAGSASPDGAARASSFIKDHGWTYRP